MLSPVTGRRGSTAGRWSQRARMLFVLAALPLLFVCAGCGPSTSAAPASGGTVNVAYAGSLVHLMEKTVGPGFAKASGDTYQGQGAGSTTLANQIAGGILTPDVFISASTAVYPLLRHSAHGNLAPWDITFGSTAMVIGYSPKSAFATQLQAAAHGMTPWYQVLQTPGLLIGRTDPRLDPKGTNTILAMELAERYYHQPGLTQHVLGSAENTAQIFPEENLVARLASGQLDVGFFYLNEVKDAGLPYITLPDQINLSNPSDASLYAQVSYTDSSGKTATGAPIVYTLTILSNASNTAGADAFVRYLLSGAGHADLTSAGILALTPTVSGDSSTLPADLKALVG